MSEDKEEKSLNRLKWEYEREMEDRLIDCRNKMLEEGDWNDEIKKKSNEIFSLENKLEEIRKELLLNISKSIEWIANIQVIKIGLYKSRGVPPNYYRLAINSLKNTTKTSEKLIEICKKLEKLTT